MTEKAKPLVFIGFKAPAALRQRLEQLAIREERPLSQVVRRYIEEGMAADEKKVNAA